MVDKQLYYKMWHFIFIHIGRTVGAYQFIIEGFVPPKKTSKQEEGVTISGVKAMAGSSSGDKKKKKDKGSAGKVFGIIAVIIIIAVVVLVITQQ